MHQPVLFGRYLLLERISVGGMAEVFRAKTFGVEDFEKIVAIKRILPSMAEDAEFITMFIDEARIAGQLSHANICQIHELGRIDGAHFIAMEYVPGKDVLQLQNRLRRVGARMPLPMAAFIAARVCDGLDYAHNKLDAQRRPMNIVHRDVSPQNVLVSYAGEVKIIDFGIAKAVSRSAKTRAGVLKGKFGYMSPEQLRGQPVDRRSDLFAMGTVLWEMCTGERLFTGSSDLAVLDKVRNAIVPRPSQHNPQVPPQLEAVVMRALRREPAERFPDARAMQEALRAFLAEESSAWTEERLAATTQELFKDDLERERAAVARFGEIRREDLPQWGGQAQAQSQPEMLAGSLLRTSSASDPGLRPPSRPKWAPTAQMDGWGDDGATVVSEAPEFLLGDQGETPTTPAPVNAAPAAWAAGVEDETDASVTRIFGENVVGANALTGEPTYVFSAEQGRLQHVGLEAKAAVLGAPPAGRSRAGTGPAVLEEEWQAGPTVIFDAAAPVAEALPDRAATPPEAREPTAAALLPATSPSFWGDVGRGVAAALVIVGLLAVGWQLFGAHATPRRASLTMTSALENAAKVYVDGNARGTLAPGQRLTLRDLVAGAHRIAMVVDGEEPVVRTVGLAAGEVKVLTIEPRVAPGPASLPVDAGAEPAPMLGRLDLATDPPDAEVVVDGVSRGRTPLMLDQLAAGRYELRIGKSGYQEQREAVSIAAGETTKLSVLLTPLVRRPSAASVAASPRPAGGARPAPEPIAPEPVPPRPRARPVATRPRESPQPAAPLAAPGPAIAGVAPSAEDRTHGYLVVNSSPWAKVLVDGQDTGRTTPITPRASFRLKRGRHRVTLVVGEQRFEFTVEVTAGKITRLIEALPVTR